MMENHVLKQHYEYFIEMQKEKEELEEEFNELKSVEKKTIENIQGMQSENTLLQNKVENFERNVALVNPIKFKEINDKID